MLGEMGGGSGYNGMEKKMGVSYRPFPLSPILPAPLTILLYPKSSREVTASRIGACLHLSCLLLLLRDFFLKFLLLGFEAVFEDSVLVVHLPDLNFKGLFLITEACVVAFQALGE